MKTDICLISFFIIVFVIPEAGKICTEDQILLMQLNLGLSQGVEKYS